jgi:FkbM family methyltransferase
MYVDIKKHLLSTPKGVIHIGGHRGEEVQLYDSLGIKNIVLIEAIEESAKIIEDKFKDRDNIIVLNECISDKEETVNFNITNNLASSSLLELGTHKESHPKIFVEKSITVNTIRLDTLINNGIIDIEKYDMLNLDIQGAELKALKSLNFYLDEIKYIYCEVNKKELYVGCALIDEIDKYLKDYKRVDTYWTRHGWGDALYIKR